MTEFAKRTGPRAAGRARTRATAVVTSQVATASNVEAVAAFIDALRAAGKLAAADEPLASMALTLAATLDDGAGYSSAAVARELRAILAALPQNVEPNELDLLLARRQERLANNGWAGASEIDDN